jgi:cytochrome c oxidase cbb3-type subunit III
MNFAGFFQKPRATRHRLTLWHSCLGVCLLWSIGTAAQERRAPKPNPLKQEDAARGMAQYKATCAMCHGSEAKGASGPSLIDSSLVRHDENGNLIGDIVRNGRIAKGMPPFPNLTDAQIAELTAFLHATVTAYDNRASASGPARGLAARRLLTGSVEEGRKFFSGEGKCAECHSSSGDLKGVAKKYSALELEGRLLYPTMPHETATVRLPSGESIHGQLLHLDPFYVALMDGSGTYHSWTLKHGVKVTVDDPLRAHRDLLDRYKDKEIHNVFAYLETLQ